MRSVACRSKIVQLRRSVRGVIAMQQGPQPVSEDGRYLWNGQAWLSLSPDGMQVWDGVRWQPRPSHQSIRPVSALYPAIGSPATRPDGSVAVALLSLLASAQGIFALVVGATGSNGGAFILGIVILVCFVLATWYSRGWTHVRSLRGGRKLVVMGVATLGALNLCLVGAIFPIIKAIQWHEDSVRA
jgi:hypothetical protein